MVHGPNEIMDIKEVADYLHVGGRTVYSLVKQKKIPGVKVGGQWRFKKSRLEAMFEQTAGE